MGIFSWLFKKKNKVEEQHKEEIIYEPDPTVKPIEEEPEEEDIVDKFINNKVSLIIDTASDYKFAKEIGATSKYFVAKPCSSGWQKIEGIDLCFKKVSKGVHPLKYGEYYLDTLFDFYERPITSIEDTSYEDSIITSFNKIYNNITGYHLIQTDYFRNDTGITSVIQKVDFKIYNENTCNPDGVVTGFILIDTVLVDPEYQEFIQKLVRNMLLS